MKNDVLAKYFIAEKGLEELEKTKLERKLIKDSTAALKKVLE
jgi:hypothetical protein